MDTYDRLLRAVDAADSLGDLREFVDGTKAAEEPLFHEFVDGVLTMSHWSVRILAGCFLDIIDKAEAPNYIAVTMTEPKSMRQIEVIIKRPGGTLPDRIDYDRMVDSSVHKSEEVTP